MFLYSSVSFYFLSANNKKLKSLQAKNLNKKTNVQDTRKESTSSHKVSR